MLIRQSRVLTSLKWKCHHFDKIFITGGIVILTISSTASDEYFVKMRIFLLLCSFVSGIQRWPLTFYLLNFFKKHENIFVFSVISWHWEGTGCLFYHYTDVIMKALASQITSLMIVYSTVYSGADQRKHQRCTSLAFVRGIHQWPVNSLHKGPVMWKMFHLMTSSCGKYRSIYPT